jgi:hypothetical protein
VELTAVSSALVRAGYTPPQSSQSPQAVSLPVEKKESGFLTADTLALSGRLVGHAAGSAFATYKFGNLMGNQMKEVYQSFKTGGPTGTEGALNGLRSLSMTGLRGAGLAGLISAGSSVIANGLGVVKGKTDSQTAISNVISDTFSGSIGGLGAVTIGGAGNLALASMGVAGLPLTIATVALGAAGGTLMGHLIHTTRNPKTDTSLETTETKIVSSD